MRLSVVIKLALAGPAWPCEDVHMSTDDLPRLARAVKARRLALGLARLKAASEADISKDTWKRVEDGLPVRELSYAAIDPVLGWAVGSCDAIRAGGEPTIATRSAAAPEVVIADVEVSPREKARGIISQSFASTGMQPIGDVKDMIDRIVDDLARKGVI